jgi:DNA polymerase III epsilon subunit family exonuclease
MQYIGSGHSDGKLSEGLVLVFDTETTGVSAEEDRVVELGALFCKRGSLCDKRKMRLDPQRDIPAGASAIHGIFDQHVVGKPTFSQIAERFAEYLSGATLGEGQPWLCGYNAVEFDGPLLNQEFSRAGLSVRIDVTQIIDPMVFARWHFRHLRSRALTSVCEHLGVPLVRAHSALADAQATWELLQKFLSLGLVPSLPSEILKQQYRFSTIMKEEWDRWSYWLYRDRTDGTLRFGAGTHCGKSVEEVPRDYTQNLLRKVPDLPQEVRAQLHPAAA